MRGQKYIDITRYLESSGRDRIDLSVEEISKIIDLPQWALNPIRHPWSNDHTSSLSCGWLNAGFRVRFDSERQVVIFAKE
jgi:hypothetical protein